MRVGVGDPHVGEALPVWLLLSGALYGRGKSNEATAGIVRRRLNRGFSGYTRCPWSSRAGETPRFLADL
jgi:hypothetical protein